MTKKYYSLRSFWHYCRQYKRRLVLVAVSFVIANSWLAIIPYFIGQLIGSLARSNPDTHAALVYVILLIACSTLHDLFWRVSELLYMKYINPLSFRYESLVFERVVHKPYAYFTDKFTGKIASYVSTLGLELNNFLQNVFWSYISESITLVAIVAILLSVNVMTAGIFVLGIALMVLGGKFTIGRSNTYEKIFTDVQSTKNSRVIDVIANFVNVKSFHSERKESQAIELELDATLASNQKSFIWSVVFWGTMSLVVRQLMWPATIVLNYYLYLHHRISIGEFTTLLSTVLLFSNYIWEVVWDISQYNLRLARIEEAYTYLFDETEIVASRLVAATKVTRPEFAHSLQLRNLSFSYPDNPDKPVLHDIDIQIKRGEKVGIVGKSGSGKSTLTKLLLGYYEVSPGALQVDMKNVSGSDLATLISFVPQDTSLFHQSIAQNIAYAHDQPMNRGAIIAAAKRAHADEFISQIPSGYDALVGERGVKLSAGQRQRIAIARAYLDDRPILIMDEATSALDSESEVLIQQALESLWGEKTVIAIAHRLSTLRNMDRIIVLEKGVIAEQGSHSELLKQKGTYARLWAHQSGGFLEE